MPQTIPPLEDAGVAAIERCPGTRACWVAREHQALTALEQTEYLADLQADRDTYRELLTRALAGWQDTIIERDRALAACARLRDQYRALREAVMQADAPRAA